MVLLMETRVDISFQQLSRFDWQDYRSFYNHTHDHSVSGVLRIAPGVYSSQLDNHRDILVYLPPSYHRGDRHYPVLYMQDGQNLFDNVTSYAGEWGVDDNATGGGDTGTDCVATSLRHGCDSLVQFEIMDQPPLERAANNPWPQWPRIYKMDYGQEEAAAVYGEDPREYGIMTKRFIGDEQGNLQALETVNVRWLPAEDGGRPKLEEVPGTEQTWAAQLVLLALGFRGPEQSLAQQFGVETGPRTNIEAEYGRFTTNVPGIFAAGDARRGQSLVVWAINEGRGVATAVDAYLMAE